MADSAYNDENAHILIFYLYMSKDRLLMEHISGNARGLFASEGMSDLEDRCCIRKRTLRHGSEAGSALSRYGEEQRGV